MHGKESNVEVCNMYQGQTVIVFFASVDSPILFATAYAQSTICSLICITVLHSTTLVSPGSCSTYEVINNQVWTMCIGWGITGPYQG